MMDAFTPVFLRWSFCVKGVLMSTEVRGHRHYTMLLVLDVHK